MNLARHFYFSLPRLISRLLGRTVIIAEDSAIEAYGGSFIIVVITYFFFASLFRDGATGWTILPMLLIAFFAVFVSWTVVLYLNSFLIRALRATGFFARTPVRYMQDFFVGALLTLCAIQLAITNSWMRWIGIAWLVFAILNLAAAVLLVAITNSGKRVATD